MIPLIDLNRRHARYQEPVERMLIDVARSGVYLSGKQTLGLTSELCDYLGARFVSLVGNGTDGLEIALRAVGVTADSLVYTVANAGGYASIAATLIGAQVGFVDIDPDTLQMDPGQLENELSNLSSKPQAVVVTHLYGQMAPIEQIVDICLAFGIPVVEDVAQAMGARRNGRAAGTLGDVGVTSFYPTKNLGGYGDGGAVFTNDMELGQRISKLAQYGWGQKYRVDLLGGRNSRMDEIQAGLVRLHLAGLDADNSRRREIYEQYRLAGGYLRFPLGSDESSAPHLAVVIGADRQLEREFFQERGIATAIHYPTCDHQQLPEWQWAEPLDNTEWASDRVLTLPLFPEMTREEVAVVSGAIGGLATKLPL